MNKAIEYLREHPDEAAYTDSPATAVLDDGLKFRVEGAGPSLVTDMPGGVGGADSAPSPGWIMRAALASCEATLIAMRAAQEAVGLESLEVTVDSESNDYGILGIDPAIPAGPSSARVEVRVSSKDASDEQLRAIIEWAHDHCPVADTVRRPIPMNLEVNP
jgi:uncharacterized OsmC-like protein